METASESHDEPTTHLTSAVHHGHMAESPRSLSSRLALTGQYPPKTYSTIREIKDSILAITERLKITDVGQYVSYKHVSAADFDYIEKNRSQLGHQVRFTYYPEISTLIIKVPSMPHEIAHRTLGDEISHLFKSMGLRMSEFVALGATKYVGETASQKEADSSWKNALLRPVNTDYPTFVIESGVSESMPRLRADAHWWISLTGGQVQIVLLIKVNTTKKTMLFEKYFPKLRQYPNTRARAQGASVAGTYIPDLISTTKVNAIPGTVVGPPITLEFQRIIGRPPVPPEGDVVIGSSQLLELARNVFA
ncbi:hypothetical protein AnigIFM63604_006330 [Aspergillus niger]|uniref:Uncharacterized protein n=2 Tax=Aspergillus TaxID=5052 RepID=A0A370PJY1_ASPPH|nr:hypothetical protein CBS147346_365 [Aspergillus niger]RDK42486.1 hypothetical protein M752DRAFT_266285 [Aspergillus phoenicis ATCC 13157]GLA27969.1 hypothetical protein AnigIFM63326_005532 [Aspergillus niger]GLA50282.1 hypothetical protein AnigIFM63604_006330 [Aspergillus niger]